MNKVMILFSYFFWKIILVIERNMEIEMKIYKHMKKEREKIDLLYMKSGRFQDVLFS